MSHLSVEFARLLLFCRCLAYRLLPTTMASQKSIAACLSSMHCVLQLIHPSLVLTRSASSAQLLLCSADALWLLQVSRTAKMMVSQMGFSKLGQVAWQSGGGPSFVGAQAGQAPDCSGHTADMIDAEVKDLVERAYRWVLLAPKRS